MGCEFLSIDSWNRIIFEISQAQPLEFGVGFSAIRVWVNEKVTPIVYFGDFSTGKIPMTDGSNAALDICSLFDPTSQNKLSPATLACYDVLNFVWIQGPIKLDNDTSSKPRY